MVTPNRLRYVAAIVGTFLLVAVSLALLGALRYDLFYLVALVGFLVVTEYTDPFTASPPWRRRLRWLVAVGLGLFVVFALRHFLLVFRATRL